MGIFSIFVGVAVALFAVIGYGMYRFWNTRKTPQEQIDELVEEFDYIPAPLQEFDYIPAPLQEYKVNDSDSVAAKKNTVSNPAPARQISFIETGIETGSENVAPNSERLDDLIDRIKQSTDGTDDTNTPTDLSVQNAMDVVDVPSGTTNTEEIVERVVLRDATDVSAGTTTYRNYTVDDRVVEPEVRVESTFTSSVERTTAYVSSSNTDSGWSPSDSSSDSSNSSSDY